MGGTPADSAAMADGCDHGAPGRCPSRAGNAHAVFRLWLSDLAVSGPTPPVSPAPNPWPDHFRRSGLQARHGAPRRAQKAVGPGLKRGDRHPVAPRGGAAWKMIVPTAGPTLSSS